MHTACILHTHMPAHIIYQYKRGLKRLFDLTPWPSKCRTCIDVTYSMYACMYVTVSMQQYYICMYALCMYVTVPM